MNRFGSLILAGPALIALLATACDAPPADPAELQSIRAVGLAYLEENRLDEAVAEFRQLVELAPREPLGHANLGLAYLRMDRLPEAERSVRRALELEENPAASLILAEILLAEGRTAEARETLAAALASDSLHARLLYALATLDAEASDLEARDRRAETLARLARAAPGNVAAQVERAAALLAAGRAREGETALRGIRQLVPEYPVEAVEPFDEALLAAATGEAEAALAAALAFQNVMRTTPAYQRGLIELRGPGGVLVGFPVVIFSESLSSDARSQEAVLTALRFTDASSSLGLGESASIADASGRGSLVVGDYDDDGDLDLYVGGRLLRNRPQGFVEASEEAGLPPIDDPRASAFADYDNDGRMDLFVADGERGRLFRNDGSGGFAEVTESLQVSLPPGAPLFGDFDHDGDLDLAIGHLGGEALFRNDLDGTFTDVGIRAGFAVAGSETGAPAAGSEGVPPARLAFGDVDDDDDLDIVVPGGGGALRLHDNRRLGLFEEISEERGAAVSDLDMVASADYNNDGWLDLLGAGRDRPGATLLLNRGDGAFEIDDRPTAFLDEARSLVIEDLSFLDLDNDGWLDVALVGSDDDGSGVVKVFRNAAAGRFDYMPDLTARFPVPAKRIEAVDFGDDGDLDLFLSLADNTARLLRNDGGNANRFLKMTLVGLSTGSGKNNHFGIGSKVEIRAGGLYQTRTVEGPELHFGLGGHARADVVRIRWTNGVPQNLFYPGANQSVVEEQILKGSCPFLYAWDGDGFAMVTDLMWKSALGMPMGLMAQGEAAFAPSGASREYLRIPGDALLEREGSYELRVTGELWEVFYLDEVELLAVDHPDSVEIFVDERFAFVTGHAPLDIRQVAERRSLAGAIDHRGRNVLAELGEADDDYVADFVPERYQGVSRMHHLTLDLGPLPEGESVALYLRGWIFPTDAGINVALSQSEDLEAVMPYLEVPDGRGGWRTAIPTLSFPAGKDKTLVQDVTGLLTPGDHRVRIGTTMNIYWDEAFFTVGDVRAPLETVRMEPSRAELRYRGVSPAFRRGGPDGPHWFDYDRAGPSPWRPIEGNLTRYGDVRSLLLADDSRYPILGPGDELALSFDAGRLPPPPPGWTRDFLIYTVGWLKDADLSTADGWRVEPLPFHGMSSYPYGPEERYPHPALVDSLHTRPPGEYPSLGGR